MNDEEKTIARESGKCPESVDGKHVFTVDLEYDPTGDTKTCEECGEIDV